MEKSSRVTAAKGGKDSGSKLAKEGSFSTGKDETPEYILINLLSQALKTVASDKDVSKVKALEGVPWDLVDQLFEALRPTNSPQVRKKAAECLGYLSKTRIRKVVNLFLAKLMSSKTDAAMKECTPHLDAVSSLAFGFEDAEQGAVTVEFLDSMSQIMGRTEKGEVRYTLCHSVGGVLKGISDKATTPPSEAYVANKAKFEKLLMTIFDLVKKWFKKPKIRTACLTLMGNIIQMGSAEIRQARGEEYLGFVIACIKEKDIANVCREYIRQFFLSVDEDFAVNHAKTFKGFIDMVVPVLFHKKATFTISEASTTCDILFSMDKGPYSIIEHPSLDQVLSSPDFTPSQVGAILQLFGRLLSGTADENGKALKEEHVPRLVKHVSPLYEAELEVAKSQTSGKGDVKPDLNSRRMLYMLQCFPFLCPSSLHESFISATVGYMQGYDLEMVDATITACKRFVDLSPSTNFCILMRAMVDGYVPSTVVAPEEDAVKALDIMIMFIQHSTAKIDEMDEPVDIDVWEDVRRKLEALCLCYLLHTSKKVWAKAKRVVELIRHPSIRPPVEHIFRGLIDVVAEDITASTDLVEATESGAREAREVPELGFPGLRKMFVDDKTGKRREDRYNEVIALAWAILQTYFTFSAPMWANHTRFLFYAYRSSGEGLTASDTSFAGELFHVNSGICSLFHYQLCFIVLFRNSDTVSKI